MASLKEINCKEIFRNAYENRYTWENDFNGYEGKCIFINNNIIHSGKFAVGKDFKPVIQKIEDENIVKSISSQLFEVSIHRVKRDFNAIHSNNNFKLLNDSEKGIEMQVYGKNNGDKYRVKDDCINMVYRKIHGIIIEIFVQSFLDTGVGILSSKYTSQEIDPETLAVNSPKFEYEDQFINIGDQNLWLLHSRKIKCLNKNQEEEFQKFIFEDLCLLN